MQEKIRHKSYAKGVPGTIRYEKTTISEALARSAKQFPDKTAMNYMGEKITYREYDTLVNQFARMLLGEGISEGDKVAFAFRTFPRHLSQISFYH